MLQNEYYITDENWPQPEDEAKTLDLEGYMGRTPTKRKKADTKKQRKKLSESLAGVTAAAIAVVMVSGATPSLRGISTGLQDVVPSEICQICGDLDCPYWDPDGMEGLRITSNANPLWQEFDLYTMNGFVFDAWDQSTAICTQRGERLILRVDPNQVLGDNGRHSYLDIHSETDAVFPSDETTYCSWEYRNLENASDRYSGYLVAQLVYSPDGVMPEQNFGVDERFFEEYEGEHYYYAALIDGVEDAEVRIYTNVERLYDAGALNYCKVEIVEGTDLTFPLGKTMTFTENGRVRRQWNDSFHAANNSTHRFQLDYGDERKSMMFNVWHKKYIISGYYNDTSISIAAESWQNIFNQWQELNDDVALKGHHVCYAITHAGEVTVNGITYDLYLLYTTAPVDGYNHYPWLSHFFVPQQEPEIAIHFRESIEPEELAELLATPADQNLNSVRKEMLECFGLR